MNTKIKVLYGNMPADQPYVEDIYDSLDDAQREHPYDQIMVGYGIIDKNTGLLLEGTKDWYDTYDSVITALLERQS